MICRLKKAKELIEKTNLSITQIAVDSGFYDAAYFSKKFKNYFNISPLALKNSVNKNKTI